MKRVIYHLIIILFSFNVAKSQVKNAIIDKDTFNIMPQYATKEKYNCYVDTFLLQGLADGKYCTLYKEDSTKVNIIFEIHNHKANGKFFTFDFDGKICTQGFLYQNLYSDFQIGYYLNGKIKEIVLFNNGKLNGIRYVFNENGCISQCILWENGYIIGTKKYIFPKKARQVNRLFLSIKIPSSKAYIISQKE
jgi:antitoxin component YwqK of YwqJK toxin-antitoxin module